MKAVSPDVILFHLIRPGGERNFVFNQFNTRLTLLNEREPIKSKENVISFNGGHNITTEKKPGT